MFPYIYLVKWWDDCELIVSHGLTFGENLPDATRRVAEYFHEDNIQEIALTAIGDGCENVLELTEELAESLKNIPL